MGMTNTGPDVPAIHCRPPDGCCGPNVCAVTEEEFVCAIRALLPEGEPWNNTRAYTPSRGPATGATTVGCAEVGCEQMVFGGCCDTPAIPCEDEPPLAPQLAVVDAFAAVAYSAVQALCAILRELDPCTAEETLHRWAERLGIEHPDQCGPGWSDEMLALLVCLFARLRFEVWTFAALQRLAALFGVCVTLREAGRFNCDGPAAGWWTMARTHTPCPPRQTCPPGPIPALPGLLALTPACQEPPLSLNIVVCPPACVELPPNCNAPPSTQPPLDPAELREAFKRLMPQLLPRNALFCVYDCNPADCVV